MDFVDNAIKTNDHHDQLNYLNNDNKYDIKNLFNDLENNFYDLKISTTETSSYNFLNNKSNVQLNSCNQLTTNKLNDNCKNNLFQNNQFNKITSTINTTNQFNLNNNLINQSYEYAKMANEFKEKFNDVHKAINFYNKAIELNPTEFRFYCNRSICLQQANCLNDALDDVNVSITLNPNARKLHIRKAEILCLLNKYNDAEYSLNYCLNLNTANDIPSEVVKEELKKLIKTVLTKFGFNDYIINKAILNCQTIDKAIDYAYSKRMEEKLNYANNNSNMILNNTNGDKNYTSIKHTDKQRHPSLTNFKSLDSPDTIDYFTDDELNNLNTSNRKISINDESFAFNQLDNSRQILNLNNYSNLYSNDQQTNSIDNLSTNHNIKQQLNTSSSIGIPIQMNRKRNSISLCEQLDNSFTKSSNNYDLFSNTNYLDSNFNLIARHLSGNSANSNHNNNTKTTLSTDQIYSKSLGSNLSFLSMNNILNSNYLNNTLAIKNYSAKENNLDFSELVPLKYKEAVERANICTNLIGYKGIWLGNVSMSCSRERLLSIFKKYGDPIIHQLKNSPCVFIKYNNVHSPTIAIQDLHGKVLPDIVHNKNEPIRLHFECNRRQQEENFPKDKSPRNFKNGECYQHRTTGCILGKKCPKIHVPINERIDFQMWMLK